MSKEKIFGDVYSKCNRCNEIDEIDMLYRIQDVYLCDVCASEMGVKNE